MSESERETQLPTVTTQSLQPIGKSRLPQNYYWERPGEAISEFDPFDGTKKTDVLPDRDPPGRS